MFYQDDLDILVEYDLFYIRFYEASLSLLVVICDVFVPYRSRPVL